MNNWNNIDLIEIIEAYASDNNLIASEEELSERFDEMIKECSSPEDLMTFENGDDLPMINETFNNWTDSLVSDGELHPEQYRLYTYVGEFPN